MSLSKISVSGAFDQLSKKRKDAVRLVFEHDLTNGEIAKKYNIFEQMRAFYW